MRILSYRLQASQRRQLLESYAEDWTNERVRQVTVIVAEQLMNEARQQQQITCHRRYRFPPLFESAKNFRHSEEMAETIWSGRHDFYAMLNAP